MPAALLLWRASTLLSYETPPLWRLNENVLNSRHYNSRTQRWQRWGRSTAMDSPVERLIKTFQTRHFITSSSPTQPSEPWKPIKTWRYHLIKKCFACQSIWFIMGCLLWWLYFQFLQLPVNYCQRVVTEIVFVQIDISYKYLHCCMLGVGGGYGKYGYLSVVPLRTDVDLKFK